MDVTKMFPVTFFPLRRTELRAANTIATEVATLGAVPAQGCAVKVNPFEIFHFGEAEQICRVSVRVCIIGGDISQRECLVLPTARNSDVDQGEFYGSVSCQ
jgi:hypothetical protein